MQWPEASRRTLVVFISLTGRTSEVKSRLHQCGEEEIKGEEKGEGRRVEGDKGRKQREGRGWGEYEMSAEERSKVVMVGE